MIYIYIYIYIYMNSFLIGFNSTSYTGFRLIGEILFPPAMEGSYETRNQEIKNIYIYIYIKGM
jgi:hypothetical protein